MAPITLLSSERVFDKFLQVEQLTVEQEGEKMQRLVVSRPPAAAVLLHNKETDQFVLVRQARPALLLTGHAPDLVEIPAGLVDQGEKPEETAFREAEEETGYRPRKLTRVAECFSSPGFATEVIHIFFAEIGPSDRQSQGGGLQAEGEQVEPVSWSRQKAYEKLQQGKITDAKTLIALQWFFMHQPPRQSSSEYL